MDPGFRPVWRAAGWSWTEFAGGVPNADDTAAALLALAHWQSAVLAGYGDDAKHAPPLPTILEAASRGAQWLLALRNSDGGWPTFACGWNESKFDRSAPDVTAHVVRALSLARMADLGRNRSGGRAARARRFDQHRDRSWTALFALRAAAGRIVAASVVRPAAVPRRARFDLWDRPSRAGAARIWDGCTRPPVPAGSTGS